MRPGPVSLDFDVTSSVGVIDTDPAGTEKFTWAVAPSPPANVHIAYQANGLAAGIPVYVVRVSWDPESVANAEAVEVYGLLKCFAPATSEGQPCIVVGTPLATKSLRQFARVTPSAGSTSWLESGGEIGDVLGWHGTVGYYALLVVAVNQYGDSRFIIAGTTTSCYQCAY
jgi:hypothetical protein